MKIVKIEEFNKTFNNEEKWDFVCGFNFLYEGLIIPVIPKNRIVEAQEYKNMYNSPWLFCGSYLSVIETITVLKGNDIPEMVKNYFNELKPHILGRLTSER